LTKRKKLSEVTHQEARKSALVVACVLALVSAWNLYRGRMTVVIVLGSIAGALVLMGFLLPALARRFHVLWMMLAGALGFINSRVLLSLVFFLLFVPYNLIARLVGRDRLNRRKAQRQSYWIPREKTRQAKEQFERLF
jgi:Saxitoxin biosynthesis operon protein SxtJ